MKNNGNFTANPFVYGKEVDGEYFYDRKDDFASLVATLAGGSSNVVLYAPRRYGKTSLAKKALDELSKRGFRCIYFDMMRVESVRKFCAAYASSAYALESGTVRAMRTVSKLLSSLRPKFTIGDDGTPAIELDFASADCATTVESALDLVERLSSERSPVVVAFDEFQEIATLSPDLPMEGIFRSCIQRHKHVRYLFLGSKTHLVKRMFGDRSRPFYNSAAIQRLAIPALGESAAFIRERFTSVGMKIDDEAVQGVLKASGGIPYYVQAVSSLSFDEAVAVGSRVVSPQIVKTAVSKLVASKADLYETALQSLSSAQRTLLSALAKEPCGRFDGNYRARHGVGSSSGLHSSLEVLLAKGLVEASQGKYALGDPIFALYLFSTPYQLFG